MTGGTSVVPGEGRAGVSVVEALVVLVLASLLVHLAWTTLREQSRVARRASAVAERLEAARATRFVLSEELRGGLPGRDWIGPAGDSLAVRAFRGVALPCVDPSGEWDGTVRYRGVRGADPEKDSVLVLSPDGRWRALDLEAAWGDPEEPCSSPVDGQEWTVERWTVPEPTGPIVALRLFERGSYHLADGALRYRRGLAGRQPLTAVLFDDPSSVLVPVGTAGVRIGLAFDEAGSSVELPPWETTVRAAVR